MGGAEFTFLSSSQVMLRLLVLGATFEIRVKKWLVQRVKMRYAYSDPHLSLAEGCPGVVNSLVPCVLVLHCPAARESP